ncbi:BZ3500_MvSof-1268-A1-R1_Chr3-1g05677 [Microbotryum saponariae]|uniref:BZ3500_MvSof-1268-A1-R1_Chr3-1g05677 protein n=1 Tax=Microbotryum saponariae TaxID=289078 RepID=A0A2X0LRJ5_9BASI|nr:BZ3500_MvSof-1268-A1-R1_Chr3-1g05677 [Microbotryum saponariae]SDA04867.1 BZ3501_MvSof-1269-A2-R1_Chr3-1g05347 [Microbotryum saponariae]
MASSSGSTTPTAARPVASTSTSAYEMAEAGASTTVTASVSRPVREDDYHTDEDETGHDHDGTGALPLLDNDDDDDDDDIGRPSQDDEGQPRGKGKGPTRLRRPSSTLMFDFSSAHLLSLATSDESTKRRNGTVSEPITVMAGVALIVGMQIGSGIFSSPGVVAKETGAVGSALLLWTFAGLLSWAGALSFAELGTALPINGGAQAYLDAAFGPLPAYCFSFTAVTALKPGSQAIISIIFGEYMCRIIWHTAFSKNPSVAARGVPTIAIKLVGILALFLLSCMQAWSTRAGTRAQLVLTVFKVFALVLVFIGGLVVLGLGRAASSFSFEGSSDKPAGYALALFSALWTFDGWDQCNYVAKDCAPGTLPLIINISLALVELLFVLANISYFLVLPFTTAVSSSTIGLDFGRGLAGPIGGVLFALIVSISCIGALNGSLYTSSRLIVSAGEQGFIPKLFARYNERRETPLNGIMLSSFLSIIFIIFGDFAHLTLFYGVCAWFFNFWVVVGLLVLRVQEPTLKRPYRTWLSTPILFASTSLFLIVLSCFSKPWESLAAFMFCFAGTVPYCIQTRRTKTAERGTPIVGLEMR